MDGGKHKVEIYFPNSQMGIKNFTVEKGKLFETVPEKEEILFLGDSITEGIGIANISKTYPQIVAEALDMTLYNQGVASYTHDERTIDEIGEADPEIVFVAMGVNEVFQSNMEENLKGKVEKYYEKLLKTFPDSKIYVMTPLTAFDRDYKKVQIVRDIIKEVVSKYEGITVINGEEILSPQMCFEDGTLLSDYVHPSDKGAKVIAEIKRGFMPLFYVGKFYAKRVIYWTHILLCLSQGKAVCVMKNFFNVFIFAGVVIIFGIMGTSDIEPLEMSYILKNVFFGSGLVIFGAVGRRFCQFFAEIKLSKRKRACVG